MRVGCEWWYAEYLRYDASAHVPSIRAAKQNVHPVDPDGRQILDVQRDERASESVAHVAHLGRTQPILELARKPVCFPLEAPRHAVERDTDDGLHRRQDHLFLPFNAQHAEDTKKKKNTTTHLKHQKRHHRRWTRRNRPREIKRANKLRRVQKRGKEREDGEYVDLGDAEELGGVHVVPVAELVREDRFDLVWLAFLDEGVKDDDVFALRGAVLVRDERGGDEDVPMGDRKSRRCCASCVSSRRSRTGVSAGN